MQFNFYLKLNYAIELLELIGIQDIKQIDKKEEEILVNKEEMILEIKMMLKDQQRKEFTMINLKKKNSKKINIEITIEEIEIIIEAIEMTEEKKEVIIIDIMIEIMDITIEIMKDTIIIVIIIMIDTIMTVIMIEAM